MITDFSRALGQLLDPASRSTFFKALAVTIACYVLLWIIAGFGLSALTDDISTASPEGWFWRQIFAALEVLADIAWVGALIVVSFLVFPGAISAILPIFLEPVCAAVERRYYPDLPAPRPQPWQEMVVDALRLALVTIAVNLVLLPLYLIPVINIFVFYIINGYLLGREYFELVGVRRLVSREVQGLRRRYRNRVFIAGVVIALLLTIPLVNLFMPIVAAAFMLHRFEGLRRKGATQGA
jgi:CysZ protein